MQYQILKSIAFSAPSIVEATHKILHNRKCVGKQWFMSHGLECWGLLYTAIPTDDMKVRLLGVMIVFAHETIRVINTNNLELFYYYILLCQYMPLNYHMAQNFTWNLIL